MDNRRHVGLDPLRIVRIERRCGRGHLDAPRVERYTAAFDSRTPLRERTVTLDLPEEEGLDDDVARGSLDHPPAEEDFGRHAAGDRPADGSGARDLFDESLPVDSQLNFEDRGWRRILDADLTEERRGRALAVLLESGMETLHVIQGPVDGLGHLEPAGNRVAAAPVSENTQARLASTAKRGAHRTFVGPWKQQLARGRRQVHVPESEVEGKDTHQQQRAVVGWAERGGIGGERTCLALTNVVAFLAVQNEHRTVLRPERGRGQHENDEGRENHRGLP